MKIHLFREFITLAETLNFTKAAEKSHITQPVLSRHIKELEDFLGTPLFLRDTHGVKLTSAGEILLTEARKIVWQYEHTLSVIRQFTGQNRRSIAIAYLGEAFAKLLIGVLEQFNLDYPNIAVHYRDVELDELLELLDDGKADIGFIVRPNLMEQWQGFDTLPFHTDPLCVAVHRSHELAQKGGKPSLHDIARYPLIRENPKEFTHSDQFSTHFLSAYRLQYTLYKEYPNLRTCFFNLERNKNTVLLLPKHRARSLGSETVLLEVAEQDYFYNMELIWSKKNSNPATALFVKTFQQHWRDFGNGLEETEPASA
ncbi:MAG: LysR family transcriptional regulator [Eikenella corrodens]|uniref:LysR family transcriptional regulator n=1 Tax=Eikenella corrodens TaxID=539 RepID=UPI0029073B9E|nr:LysR family transcriptional regulator [Eikenella corrodens]MDU4301232.1 LysR family transcriptional regulator [Eikenella corrodens]